MIYTTIEQAERQAAERMQKHNPPTKDMTLRDHFAAKAMQALLAYKESTLENVAEVAYQMADAMLKARNK